MDNREEKLKALMELAEKSEAQRVKLLSCDQVVIDSRAQLKCEIPKCPNYGTKLMCPPNVIKADDLKEKVKAYAHAILVQLDSPLPTPMKASIEKASDMAGLFKDDDFRKIYEDTFTPAKLKILNVVNKIESRAFSMGFQFATAFTAGSCPLCKECVNVQSGQPCRHPFSARPSMEGAGIDVCQTALNAGLPFDLPVKDKAVWNGLVFIG